MIKKIISGGQTGADQAALDAAIHWHIDHGGWIPKGRLTEAGRLPDKYKLTEMPTDSYQDRTEQNVIDSEGTLIISHGPLIGGSKHTQEKAKEYNKPCLHIDLNDTNTFQAAHDIQCWIDEHDIEVLNVAGARASEDIYIYQATIHLLTAIFHMDDVVDCSLDNSFKAASSLPGSVKEVMKILMNELPLRDKTHIAKVNEADLILLYPSLGSYIRNKYLWTGNELLMQDCRDESGIDDIDENDASEIIIQALWKELKKTHRLHIVKG